MSDSLRLYIHESSSTLCVAKGLHRSGSRVRPISFNDVLYGSDNDTPCGIVQSATAERVDRENYLYRVSYIPWDGTLHPIDSFVVWRQPKSPEPQPEHPVNRIQAQAAVPQPTLQPAPQPAVAPAVNGQRSKRNKKQSVNGQHGARAQASAEAATATV